MSSTMAVVATSPWLNTQQVAAEIKAQEWHVRRLAARGSLRGSYTNLQELKVRPEDLADWVSKGMPDGSPPEISPELGWFMAGGEFAGGMGLDRSIKEIIIQQIAELEGRPPLDERYEIRINNTVPVSGEIAKLVNSGPENKRTMESMISLPSNAKAPRWKTQAEAFAVLKLREFVRGGVENRGSSLDLALAFSDPHANPLDTLYRSQSGYQQFVAYGWSKWDETTIEVRETFNIKGVAYDRGPNPLLAC